ncbi:hypothetical protein TNCT_116621 [Trichonephila clavata]|uniref:Uncharacterized protein n=1 Tax=Trichonephila clavata TaxID=2740835 RepID=A0A8X6JEP3_TRICU|nr:hypothetical protein TNCT_116621 [Trichonephila clavata]
MGLLKKESNNGRNRIAFAPSTSARKNKDSNLGKMTGLYQKTLLNILATLFCVALAECGNVYKIGVGIADITGPAAEINMFGYD